MTNLSLRTVGVVAAVGLLASAAVGVAIAADDAPPSATCTKAPKVKDVPAGSRITVVCTVPRPPAVTETVTVPGPTVTVTAEPTQEPSVEPSGEPSSTPTDPTVTPTETPTTDPTVPPSKGGFPTAETAGTPAGWTPARTVNGDYTVTTAGAVVEDLRVNGNIIVNANNVTLRRVDVIGGGIDTYAGSTCRSGLLVEDSTIRRGTAQTRGDHPAVSGAAYTARRVEVEGLPEGFRDGGKSGGCTGTTTIEDSYAHVVSPDVCGDWHGDGLQGYDGTPLVVRNTVLWLDERNGCGGTAPFFVPSGQGNTSVDVDGLIVRGGGYSFRNGVAGTVRNLHVVSGGWGYGPVDVKCSALTAWQASVSTLDSNGQPVPVRSQGCTGDGT